MDLPAVYGVVFSENRTKVLLVERRDLPVWVLPGGGLDLNEKPEEGVVREVQEETGFHDAVKKQTAEYLPVNKMTKKTYVFECIILNGEAKPNEEARQVSFFALNDLPKRLAPPFKGWIFDALENQEKIIKKTEGVSYFILIKLLCLHPVTVLRYFLTKIGIRFNKKD